MATQTLEFNAATGLTISCKLFALESDTVVATVTATEKTNDKNRYSVAFTDIAAGAYRLNGFVGSVGGFVNEVYDLLLATDRYLPRSEAASGGATLSGDYAITVTVTDADTNDPIEAAKVRMYRTGQTGTQLTDEDGESVFGLDAATWSYIVSASGYQSATGTKVVNADGTLAIELELIAVETPTDPDLATLVVKTLDQTGAIEASVDVDVRLVKIPTGSTGIAFDGAKQTATSNVSGIATFTVVRGATYQFKRGSANVWKSAVIADADSTTVTSFIGSE